MKSKRGQFPLDTKQVLRRARRLSLLEVAELYEFVGEVAASGEDPEWSACREKVFLILAEKWIALFQTLSEQGQAELLEELAEVNKLWPRHFGALDGIPAQKGRRDH